MAHRMSRKQRIPAGKTQETRVARKSIATRVDVLELLADVFEEAVEQIPW